MPIGDLLASIGGGESAPKRKAEEQLQVASKAPRINSPTVSRPIQPSRPLDRPNASTSTNGNGIRSTLSSALKPTNGTNRVTKPSAPVRSSSNGPASSAAAASRAPPKKGSFAEIMARAKAAQQTMGQVGKIQHKKAEGGVLKKEKEVLSKPDPRARADPRPAGKKPVPSSSYAGTSKGSSRAPVTGSHPRDPRGKPASRPSSDRDRKPTAEEAEKKQKKAATATTGYTGTARPKPGSTSRKDKAPRGGALLNRPVSRPGSSRYSRYEEDYDEELDDFIDYDDEEDEPRYKYDSGSESDMEAGMDELDIEEKRAETIARREDEIEQRREKQLKAEKEERRRRLLQGPRR